MSTIRTWCVKLWPWSVVNRVKRIDRKINKMTAVLTRKFFPDSVDERIVCKLKEYLRLDPHGQCNFTTPLKKPKEINYEVDDCGCVKINSDQSINIRS